MPQAALYLQTSAKVRTSCNSACLFVKTYGPFYGKIKNIFNTEFVDISTEILTFCYDFFNREYVIQSFLTLALTPETEINFVVRYKSRTNNHFMNSICSYNKTNEMH